MIYSDALCISVRERTVKIGKGMGDYPWGFRIQFSKPIVVTEVDTSKLLRLQIRLAQQQKCVYVKAKVRNSLVFQNRFYKIE